PHLSTSSCTTFPLSHRTLTSQPLMYAIFPIHPSASQLAPSSCSIFPPSRRTLTVPQLMYAIFPIYPSKSRLASSFCSIFPTYRCTLTAPHAHVCHISHTSVRIPTSLNILFH